jgi:hypothetical protein
MCRNALLTNTQSWNLNLQSRLWHYEVFLAEAHCKQHFKQSELNKYAVRLPPFRYEEWRWSYKGVCFIAGVMCWWRERALISVSPDYPEKWAEKGSFIGYCSPDPSDRTQRARDSLTVTWGTIAIGSPCLMFKAIELWLWKRIRTGIAQTHIPN